MLVVRGKFSARVMLMQPYPPHVATLPNVAISRGLAIDKWRLILAISNTRRERDNDCIYPAAVDFLNYFSEQ